MLDWWVLRPPRGCSAKPLRGTLRLSSQDWWVLRLPSLKPWSSLDWWVLRPWFWVPRLNVTNLLSLCRQLHCPEPGLENWFRVEV